MVIMTFPVIKKIFFGGGFKIPFLSFIMAQGTSGEIDSILRGLQSQPGVIGTIILKTNGLPYKTSFKEAETIRYAGLVTEFTKKCKASLEGLLNNEPISVIRIRSHKNEIIITPDNDLILVVVQEAKITE